MSESPTRSAWETDASQHTPSKRQRREAAAATPATPASPPSLRQRGVSLARVAADVGSLAAATSRHPRFASAELYGPLLGAADAGAAGAPWLELAAAPRPGGDRVTWLCVDVEMCERRSDGARFPLAVCAVALTWEAAAGGVAAAARTVVEGLVDPDCGEALGWRSPDYGDRLAWKDEVHGLAWADHVAAPALLGLGDVQRALAAAWDDTTFLVGHKLSADLRALRVRGDALRRRSIDTVLLHWAPRAAAPGLRALLADVPEGGAARAAAGLGARAEGPAHDAGADVAATLVVALHDLLRCAAGLDAGPSFAPRAAAAPRRPRATVDAPARLVGRVIGKRGAALAALRGAHPAVDVDVDSDAAAGGGSRVVVAGDDPAAVAACLDALAARVPDLAAAAGAAKRDFLAKHAPPGDRGAA
jgi:hypothetical protein